ncbi:MAG: HAMP domain-containing sensor histidine kinase [Eubacterium sp.]|nr:HAMP domain-containing sensor histidine kinase [Eubacterium sp.]
MNTKIKFDFKTIGFKLWCYFILFAAILIGLIWLLQIYFLDSFYEDMKLHETKQAAQDLIDEFNINGKEALSNKISELSSESDTYVRVETGDGRVVILPEYNGYKQQYLYSLQATSLRQRLEMSTFPSVSVILPFQNNQLLAYATYLYKAEDGISPEQNMANSYILYLFSPLSPVKSTISILHTQLVYITFIAMFLALSISLYMTSMISRPIKNITKSAEEMGKGHYGVQFRRSSYSEINNLADTLSHASRELEKTDMYQKDLIANVSHDLKTPLTMIKSYAEMIRDLSGDNPLKRDLHLGVIIEEADRLNILVNDMLNMSRMQQRKIVLEQNEFNIAETVSALLTSYEILSENEGYKFIYNNTESFMVKADEAKIKQVLSNLINNAVKYCGEDKEIIINVRRVMRTKVRCEIIDHGQGIASDEISHVWERYYKSSTHHVRQTDGSGLGLSIVREILNLHKANYGVNSKLGKGSTFWFELDIIKQKK